MKLGLVELLRRPLRFGVAGSALVLLAVLLLFLGGLLDGLYLGSTGALRAQEAPLITFSSDARESLIRSRVSPEVRSEVEAVPGVASTAGLGIALVGGRVPDEDELANLAVAGFEQPVRSMPDDVDLAPDEALADRSLEAAGVALGDTVAVGSGETPVEVVGWVEDTDYLQQSGFWVRPETWRGILAESRPDAVLPDGTFQVLTVTLESGADVDEVAAAIDAATDGATSTLTREAAVLALPGIQEQNSTFGAIIYVTLFVAGLVIALFFALLTLERTGLYGVLKAIGASTRQIFAGVVAQSVAVAVVSFAIGLAVMLGLAQLLPAEVPVAIETSRVVQIGVGLVVMSALGAAVSLRRVVRVDPASAIG
ncbi:ABC transporter permease [Rhabdothermincola salaria]|uniref:ABC transporter permease n=1 Tax=Rhabdothermincola salaria TaxID=2903142 RepID=UPI001E64E0AD|nr:ABC transporter permease [Rhabdothermincola salaria]